MKKSDWKLWASVAEIASAIAVVLSLVYVGYELNRSTNLLDTGRNTEILHAMRSWEQLVIADKELVEIFTHGPSKYAEFTDVEQFRYRYLIAQYVAIWEQAYDDHNAGLMQAESWEVWNRTFRPELPQIISVWSEISVYYSNQFQQHIGTEISLYLDPIVISE
jgi:hypothetical protein